MVWDMQIDYQSLQSLELVGIRYYSFVNCDGVIAPTFMWRSMLNNVLVKSDDLPDAPKLFNITKKGVKEIKLRVTDTYIRAI